MTADTTLDRQPAIDERRAAYEAAVAYALLDETPSEREERLELVRAVSGMAFEALRLDDEPAMN